MFHTVCKSVVILALTVSFAGVMSSALAETQQKPQQNACGDGSIVSGTWDTNWGELYLQQQNTTITGSYVHDNGKIQGQLMPDGTFRAWWSESPSYQAPSDAGATVWKFNPDKTSFSGPWGYGNNLDQGEWTGTRRKAANCNDTPASPTSENSCRTLWVQNKMDVPDFQF